MISGALFLSGSQSIGHILKKNVLRIMTAFIFWSVLYAVFMVRFEDCPKELGLQQFFNGHYHMWFLFMIVGLYLLVPFLRPIVRDEKLLRCFLLLTLVLTSFASRRIDMATELFYGYDAFNVLFVCLAIFLFARQHLNFPKLGEKGHARIRALSRWSFGAYLVHPMFIEALDIFLHFNTLSLNVFFSVPLLTLLIGTAAFLVSALLHQIPFVNKYFV